MVPMVSEPSGEGERPSPNAIDRIVGRLGAHRSLPAVGATSPAALGPPSPVADESHLTREPVSEVVVDPSSIYVTLELRGASSAWTVSRFWVVVTSKVSRDAPRSSRVT